MTLQENDNPAFERAHKARFGFIDRDKKLVIEAVSVEAVGGGATFRGASAQDHSGPSFPPRRAARVFSPAANGTGAPCICATRLRPGTR